MFTPQQMWCVVEEHALVAQTSLSVIATIRISAFRRGRFQLCQSR
ncbi:hypothetical protein [Cupriavidus sp. YR651]|nr:hypothetical protein [Cupriavidus sp. YR651]